MRRAGDEFVAGFDYPMFVVTTVDPHTGDRGGCLVGFATQCSIEPFRFLVCLSRQNRTFRVAGSAEVLAVHVLDRDSAEQREVGRVFGGETGDEVDKFRLCAWFPGPSGVPLLRDCARRLVGRVLDRFDLGDHVGFLLAPLDIHVGEEDSEPLDFHAVSDLDPGHPAGA